jgi:zinc-binding alcohol dehydrogenase family protein
MRAIGYNASRSTLEADCLVAFDTPAPTPSATDLLVRVEAVSINPVDTKVRRRETPPAGDWRVLGWDAVGTVEAVGAAVSGFSPGDQVWYAGALDRPGCNSELHCVDHRLAALRPRSLTAAQAAALPLTAITAWELLFDRLRLPRRSEPCRPQTLLVVGAAGGVGSVLVQLAAHLTAFTVVGTASRPESQRWLRELGVEHVLDHHQPLAEQWAALDLPPVTAAVSLTHTAQHFPALVEVLEPQGALALIDDPDPSAINVLALKRKSLALHWELMFTRSLYQTHDMACQGQLLAEVAALVDAGRLRTTLRSCLGAISASTLQEGHRLLECNQSIGKLVLEGWG